MPYRPAMRSDQIALQLYTVRRLAADDLPGTLAAVAAAGYRSVEMAGPSRRRARPSWLRLLDDAGLSAMALPRADRRAAARLGGRRRSARRDRLPPGDRAVAARGGAADGRWRPPLRGRPGRVRRAPRRARDPPRLPQPRLRVRAARGHDRLGSPARRAAARGRARARRLLGGRRRTRPGRRDRATATASASCT